MARVILRKEVENLGEVGDVVEVKDGYALNYLIPRGLALHATASTVRATQHEQRIREAQVQAARRTAEEAAGKFQGVEVELAMKAGEDGRLFGSVTNRQIEEALAAQGLEVSRRRIHLDEPIRRLGEYEVPIRLHAEVRTAIRLRVVAEEAPAEAAPPVEAAAAEGGERAPGKAEEGA
jgi:large subunit ribosomal protein L9